MSQPTWGRLRSRPDAVAALREMEFLELPVVDGPRYTGSGMTETLAHHAHAQQDFDSILPPERSGGWGRPAPFMQHRIIDPDTGEDAGGRHARRAVGPRLRTDGRHEQARA